MSTLMNNQHLSHSSNPHQQPKPSSSTAFPPNTAISSSASVFGRMPLEDVLEDLASRFILNLPIVELSQIERVCFQVEQAHWFYEDFVRPASSLNLPSYHLKTFTSLFFEKCEFLTIEGAPLAGWDPKTAYEKFMRYKERVPVCGAIMFNEDATQVLLVRGFKPNSSWSFPRGKINENELPRDCAVREVLEETGFNIEPFLSLAHNSSDDSKTSAIHKYRPTNPTPSGQPPHRSHQGSTLHSEGGDHFIEITIHEQRLRMYLVAGIPKNTAFVTQTRQEIGCIAWFPLSDLPTFTSSNSKVGDRQLSKMIRVSSTSAAVESDGNHHVHSKFYMVVPFVNDIRTWLITHHLIPPHQPHVQTHPQIPRHQNHEGHRHISEAAAVHDRFSRLEAFDFIQQDSTPVPSTTQDTSLIPSSKKKKKRHQPQQQQQKPPREKLNHVIHAMGDPSYHSDQQVSTDDEEVQANDTPPWSNLEEGTRALQNFFFGSQSKERDSTEA